MLQPLGLSDGKSAKAMEAAASAKGMEATVAAAVMAAASARKATAAARLAFEPGFPARCSIRCTAQPDPSDHLRCKP